METVVDTRQRSWQNSVEGHSEQNPRSRKNKRRNVICNPEHSKNYQKYVRRSKTDTATSKSRDGSGPQFYGWQTYAGKSHFSTVREVAPGGQQGVGVVPNGNLPYPFEGIRPNKRYTHVERDY